MFDVIVQSLQLNHEPLAFSGECVGFFYFDESIQQRAGFIVGAFVYSETDLTQAVFKAISDAGLEPQVDEFKSGARMDSRPDQVKARAGLRKILRTVRIGLTVIPVSVRSTLGTEALVALEKIIVANELVASQHEVYFDEGITVDPDMVAGLGARVGVSCDVFFDQDSRLVGGIQIADLAAHSMGVMLLEHLGYLKKMVKAGKNSGYDPDLDIDLGFELWASLRYSFFMAAQPNREPEDPRLNVADHGLHIATSCDKALHVASSSDSANATLVVSTEKASPRLDCQHLIHRICTIPVVTRRLTESSCSRRTTRSFSSTLLRRWLGGDSVQNFH